MVYRSHYQRLEIHEQEMTTGTVNLKIVTYNLHGINQGKMYLTSLCEEYDVVFVQEHWLAPFDLDYGYVKQCVQ